MPISILMTSSQNRAARVAFFAVLGASVASVAFGLLADASNPAAIMVVWFAGAMVGLVASWDFEAVRAEMRFTSDGWSLLGWLCVFFMPIVGIVIGGVLRARGSAQGLPMVGASLAALALYAAFALA